MKIVITGASKGIGLAEARLLSEQGHKLFLVASSEASFTEPINGAILLGYDLAEPSSISAMVTELASYTDTIDVLINNVGIMVMKKFADMDEQEINSLLDVNLRSTILTTRALLPFLNNSMNPQIVFMSSMAAKSSIVGESVYSATKAAVTNFASVLRNEMSNKIKVSTVHSWGVNTFGSDIEALLKPAQVAEAVNFIIGREKNFLIESIDLSHPGQWRGGEAPWSPK